MSNVTTLTQTSARVSCKNAYLDAPKSRFCYLSFFEISIFGYLRLRLACNYNGYPPLFPMISPIFHAVHCWKVPAPLEWSRPEIRKAGRLGNDRPSLGARLGVGLSKPWGVWEGASMSGLGGRRRAIWIRGCRARWLKALPILGSQTPFKYEIQLRERLYKPNLTNRAASRYLQNCISGSGATRRFAGNCCMLQMADSRKWGCRFAVHSSICLEFQGLDFLRTKECGRLTAN
jgi:hypothetical protein